MDNRRALFWMVFLGSAAVVAVIPEYFFPEQPEQVPLATRHGPLSPPAVPVPAAAGARPEPGAAQPPLRVAGSDQGLFSPHSWRVAPPPAPVAVWTPPPPPPPVAPRPPEAPALPFEFIGKMDDAERLRVFLTRGDKIYTVSVGDVIDGTYRVERIAGSEMVLTYLPLKLKQTLSVGDRL